MFNLIYTSNYLYLNETGSASNRPLFLKLKMVTVAGAELAFQISILRVRFHLRGAVTAVRNGFLGHSIFMLCVSTTAGRLRDGGGCPRRVRRNGFRSHFSAPPCGAVAVWRQLAPSVLKYRSCDIDINDDPIALKLDGPICCCAVDLPVKFQSDRRTMLISRLRDFTES